MGNQMVTKKGMLSDSDTYWIVESKFEPIRPAKDLVLRERLINPLLNAGNIKLTLIAAPAGYGKSSLLAQWASNVDGAKTQIVWLTLEKGDADPKQYLAYLVFALQRAGVDTKELITAAKNRFPDSQIENVVNAIQRAVRQARRKFILILEDYHSAECTVINHITTRLIKESGPYFSLIIDSRKRPKLEIFSLIALGEAQEIGPNDLRLTEQETYAALADLDNQQACQEIYAKTEGWPVAVQLARIKKKSFPHQPILAGVDGGVVACYLAEQVLSFLDEDTKNFLLAVSFLDRFNAALTNHVLANPEGWQQIEKLAAFYTLFVPLDEQGGWYRLHHLFAEYLRDLQHKKDHGLANLYLLRASDWYEHHRNLVLAVQYAARAESFDICEQIIHRAGGWSIILYDGIEVLRTMLRLIPDEYKGHSPRLLIAHAYLHCKDGTIGEARRLIEEARQQIAPNTDSRLEVDLLVIETLIYLYEDQDSPSQEYQQKLAHYRDNGDTLPLELGIFKCFELLNHLAEGNVCEAAENLEQAFSFMRQSGSVLGLNYCYLHAALLALIQADLKLASDNTSRALKMAEENFGMDSGLKTIASLLHYVLLVWQGTATAEDLPKLREALSTTLTADGWGDIYIIGTEAAVMLAKQLGDKKLAEEILLDVIHHANQRELKRLRIFAESQKAALFPNVCNTAERLLESQFDNRDWHAALAVVSAKGLTSRKSAEHTFTQIQDFVAHKQIALYQVCLDLALTSQETKAPFPHLLHALEESVEDKLWGPFLASTEVLANLRKLRKSLDNHPQNAAIHAAIDEIIQLEQNLNRSAANNLLSERELEILQQLASGHSNKEIARALALTENTVKFHLKNIFSKLDVKKRTQALLQAQNLGLIE